MKFRTLIVPFALWFSLVSATEPPELDKLRKDLEKELSDLNEPIARLQETYSNYLEKQGEEFRKNGDLESFIVVEKEIDQFRSGGVDVSSVPQILRLQKIYRERAENLEASHAEKARPVIEKFRKRAEELATQWTRIDRIEDAKKARLEAQRLDKLAGGSSNVVAVVKQSKSVPIQDGIAGDEAGDEMRNSLGMTLCWIPAGRFTMGSPETEEGRDPALEKQVEVELPRGFWMGKFEVTQEEFHDIFDSYSSHWSRFGATLPADQVTWNKAAEFCETLTIIEREMKKIGEHWKYDLPTEAEWEYACRAGSAGPFYDEIEEIAWFQGNEGPRGNHAMTHPVGEKKENEWGLHDMHGNVSEWCSDWFKNDSLEGGVAPEGADSGTSKVRRGGAWSRPAVECRAAYRHSFPPTTESNGTGFRIVLRRID